MLIIFIFVLGAQKNRLTEYLYLTYALVGPAFIRTGSFYVPTLPATEGGIQWHRGGGGIILERIPSALAMDRISHE